MFTVTGGPLETPDGKVYDGVTVTFTPSLSKVLPGGGKVAFGAGSGKVVAGVLKAADGVAALQLEWVAGLQYLVQMVSSTGSFVAAFTPFWMNVPPADGQSVDLSSVVPVPLNSGAALADVIAKINKQAFAGGRYDLNNYALLADGSHLIVPTVVPVAGLADVQGLSSGGWNMTGKGGLYRLSIYADFTLNRALVAGERAYLSLNIKRVDTQANIFGDTWSATKVGVYGPDSNQHADSYIYIADDSGVISFTVSCSTTSVGGALTMSPDLQPDLQRVAGYPV